VGAAFLWVIPHGLLNLKVCLMRTILFLLMLVLAACDAGHTDVAETAKDTLKKDDYQESRIEYERKREDTVEVSAPVGSESKPKVEGQAFANGRFKDVRVVKEGERSYRVTGRAQVFEASFSWIVEDGHEELLKGHQMTDAGAPEWGKFEFTISPQKKRSNSSLTLVLFEASAIDGSRQHELPVPLK
jgi:hypothetical protein